jgi:phosphoribosylformylglycinamidine synthase
MSQVKILILRGPGTNCDVETAFAFQQAGTITSLVHISQLIRREQQLKDYQIMVIPGGFTYGDDLGAGKVLANELSLKLGQDVSRFIASGRLIMGICNGFQVLVKAGILPGPVSARRQTLTLTTNDSGRFECRWVHLVANKNSRCVFTRGIDHLYLPVAHGEGKVIADAEALVNLDVALSYTDDRGNAAGGYPHNPNGSVNNIAGICDSTGRIFALMPHPERHIRGSQHPGWTGGQNGDGDGRKIFGNAVEWIKSL